VGRNLLSGWPKLIPKLQQAQKILTYHTESHKGKINEKRTPDGSLRKDGRIAGLVKGRKNLPKDCPASKRISDRSERSSAELKNRGGEN